MRPSTDGVGVGLPSDGVSARFVLVIRRGSEIANVTWWETFCAALNAGRDSKAISYSIYPVGNSSLLEAMT